MSSYSWRRLVFSNRPSSRSNIVMLIGALSFFPALALGPIAEHFLMLG